MNWIIITSVVIALWAALRVLGGEREKQLQDAKFDLTPTPVPAQPAAAAPSKAPAKPAAKKAA